MHPLLAARQTVAELFNAAPLGDGDHVGYLNWSHDLVKAIQSAASHGASESEVEGYVDHSFDLVYPYLPLDVEDWPDWSKPAFVQARLRMLKQREADMLQASISRAPHSSESAAAETTLTQPSVQPVASTSPEGPFAAGPSHPFSRPAQSDLTDSPHPSHQRDVPEAPQGHEPVAPPLSSLMDDQSLKRKLEDAGVSQRQDKRAKPVITAMPPHPCSMLPRS
ncbi:uncharacterized protein TRAVEDRAFT_22410 [Trametes versicolor FP-101664 SS1]|uniref:uncharacterized protein n=1 Tax=Trametes versicolor (strain FP-101664) TaxID=717944 RepID=UPI00046213C9|nr:uncharacterized protein TRAVEDRAFT_22410 [Trametes versicolor FP-101664 SS1]EIW56032.1 hypothetical protein TRAVEDRAFT_22410 [Trametes versicolor FP-101664 SS1]